MGFDPISSIVDTARTILNKIFPDADEKMKEKFALATAQLQVESQQILAQLDINKVEAQSPHIFIAGPRPAAMWVCVAGLAYTVGYPLMVWACGLFSVQAPPALDTAYLSYLLGALLGIGGMRSYDKSKGSDTKGVSF